MDRFGARLKKYRKDNGLSQKVLAQKLGVAQTTIANYENDIRFPNENILKQLAEILNISLDMLLGRTDEADEQTTSPISKEEFAEIVLAGRDDEAIELAVQLAKSGCDVFDIYDQYLKETLYLVGQLWTEGKLSVADEHHITSTIERIISVLIPYNKRLGDSLNSVVLMTMSNEPHLIGLRMVNERFKAYGWRTYFIGTSIPWNDVVNMINNQMINYIALSVTLTHDINVTIAFMEYLRMYTPVKFIIGGQALTAHPNLLAQMKPDHYASTSEEFLQLIKELS